MGRLRALALLLACGGVACAEVRLSPEERVNLLFLPSPGQAAIYMLRPGAVGREYMLPIVNDRVIGGLRPGTYLRVDVAPGRHHLHGSFAGIDRSPPLEVEVSAGDLFFARLARDYTSVVPKIEVHALDVHEGRRILHRFRRGVSFSSAPRPPTRADRDRAERIAPPHGRGLVYVVRRGMEPVAARGLPEGTEPPRSKLAVLLDGYVAALLAKHTYTAFEVELGHHALVSVVFPTHSLEPVEVDVEAGRVYFFEASTVDRGDERRAAIDALSAADGRALLRSDRIEWLE